MLARSPVRHRKMRFVDLAAPNLRAAHRIAGGVQRRAQRGSAAGTERRQLAPARARSRSRASAHRHRESSVRRGALRRASLRARGRRRRLWPARARRPGARGGAVERDHHSRLNGARRPRRRTCAWVTRRPRAAASVWNQSIAPCSAWDCARPPACALLVRASPRRRASACAARGSVSQRGSPARGASGTGVGAGAALRRSSAAARRGWVHLRRRGRGPPRVKSRPAPLLPRELGGSARAATVPERELRDRIDVDIRDGRALVPGRVGARGAQHREVCAHALDARGVAERRDARARGRRAESPRAGSGPLAARAQCALWRMLRDEGGRIALVASRAVTIRARSGGSIVAVAVTDRPKRSVSWGAARPRRVHGADHTKRAACACETPSRSTTFWPLAAASSSRSTRASGKRFTSSTYSTPPFARASRPG